MKKNGNCGSSTTSGFLKVFKPDNSLIETVGIIKQMFKFNIEDPRPFVQELVEEERLRVYKEIMNMDPSLLIVNHYNIKLATVQGILSEIKYDISHNGFKIDQLNVWCMNAYYTFIEESQNVDNYQYQWIQEYLTHKNINSIKPVVLFESKKIKIYIENGSLVLNENRSKYTIDIRYNKTNNSFYI